MSMRTRMTKTMTTTTVNNKGQSNVYYFLVMFILLASPCKSPLPVGDWDPCLIQWYRYLGPVPHKCPCHLAKWHYIPSNTLAGCTSVTDIQTDGQTMLWQHLSQQEESPSAMQPNNKHFYSIIWPWLHRHWKCYLLHNWCLKPVQGELS